MSEAFRSLTKLALFWLGLSLSWQCAVCADGRFPSVEAYRNKWALWDAEGQHFGTNDVLAIKRDYGGVGYFFRDKSRTYAVTTVFDSFKQ